MSWRRALAAVAAGLAASLSFPTPGFVPIAFVAWAPLLLALEGATTAGGAALGLAAGAAFFAVVVRWLAALSLPLWIAMSLYLALYVAVFGAIAARLWRGPRASILALPAAWVAVEWIRGWLFGGFPWAELGTALASEPRLVSLASVGGVALLSLAVMSCNLALAMVVRGLRARSANPVAVTSAALVAAAVPCALVFHSLVVAPPPDAAAATAVADSGVAAANEVAADSAAAATAPDAIAGRSLSVALIGGDTDPRIETGSDAFAHALRSYVAGTDRVLEAGRADVVLWPETALPHPIDESGLAIHARALHQRIEHHWKTPLLFGVPVPAGESAFWNEAQLWFARDVARYRKRRLVPLGEYSVDVPLVGRLAKVLPGPDVVAGPGGEPFVVAGVRLGVLVCFEDLFSADVIERAASADALVVLTNDVWLGEAGAAQHLGAAVLRAVESGRWIARVANRGATAIIDPHGRVAPAALAPQELSATEGRTPYAAAPWLGPLLAVAATLVALAASRRVRPSCG